jgi:biotin carboxylase
VLKPLSLSASQGVMRADNREEFREASRRLLRLLQRPEIRSANPPAAPVALVEDYIPGVEVAVDGILLDGELKILAIFDKPDLLEGPYFEETIYVTPSRLSGAQQSAIADSARNCVRALGLTYGPVHAEFRINDRGVWPIEVAPRPIGGLCAVSLSFISSRHSEIIGLEELLLRHAVGEDITHWNREARASGVMMIPVPKSGVLQGLSGEHDARHVPQITGVQITARLHDSILAWPEGSSYLGFIFAKAGSPKEVEAALRNSHAKLKFQIRESLPVEHPVTRKIHR